MTLCLTLCMIALLAVLDVEKEQHVYKWRDEIEMRTVFIYMTKRFFCMLCVVCVAVSRTESDGQVLSERKQQLVHQATSV